MRLLSWLVWPWRRRWRVQSTVASVHDIPDRLPRRRAVLVALDKHSKWLAFDCPCKDRHRVLLNLNPNRRPAWTIHTLTPLTITPSIDETQATKRCHYFLQNGQVVRV